MQFESEFLVHFYFMFGLNPFWLAHKVIVTTRSVFIIRTAKHLRASYLNGVKPVFDKTTF